MTGPRPAGRPWALAEDTQLRELVASRVKAGLIAKKLKRSPGAVYARINSFKKLPARFAFQCAAPLAPFRAFGGVRESGERSPGRDRTEGQEQVSEPKKAALRRQRTWLCRG
jgi:hypothetical protein